MSIIFAAALAHSVVPGGFSKISTYRGQEAFRAASVAFMSMRETCKRSNSMFCKWASNSSLCDILSAEKQVENEFRLKVASVTTMGLMHTDVFYDNYNVSMSIHFPAASVQIADVNMNVSEFEHIAPPCIPAHRDICPFVIHPVCSNYVDYVNKCEAVRDCRIDIKEGPCLISSN